MQKDLACSIFELEQLLLTHLGVGLRHDGVVKAVENGQNFAPLRAVARLVLFLAFKKQ